MVPRKKTTAKIKDSLIKLLETAPLDDITVTALCDAADISRATFYYHYDSVPDVFAELENQMESEFNQSLIRAAFRGDGTPEKSFYVTFFEFVSRNAAICRIILNSPHSGNSSFLTRAIESGRNKVTGMMIKLYPDCPTSKIEFYYIFVSHGFLGLLEYWLNSGMRESIDEIAEVGERISNAGVSYLEKDD